MHNRIRAVAAWRSNSDTARILRYESETMALVSTRPSYIRVKMVISDYRECVSELHAYAESSKSKALPLQELTFRSWFLAMFAFYIRGLLSFLAFASSTG